MHLQSQGKWVLRNPALWWPSSIQAVLQMDTAFHHLPLKTNPPQSLWKGYLDWRTTKGTIWKLPKTRILYNPEQLLKEPSGDSGEEHDLIGSQQCWEGPLSKCWINDWKTPEERGKQTGLLQLLPPHLSLPHSMAVPGLSQHTGHKVTQWASWDMNTTSRTQIKERVEIHELKQCSFLLFRGGPPTPSPPRASSSH